jgi:RNA polymerase sigma-70 factor (ECF subfamily)
MNATQVEAIRAFYERDRQQLYTYAVSITRNREAAEDAIHGVLEAILRSKGLPADLRPYVFRAIRNAAFDSWRRAKVRTDSIFQAADEADGAASGPAGAFGTNDLEPFLQRLSSDEREAIILKIYSGLTFQEIADLRAAPVPTVASWYRRGLDRLRIMLTPEC